MHGPALCSHPSTAANNGGSGGSGSGGSGSGSGGGGGGGGGGDGGSCPYLGGNGVNAGFGGGTSYTSTRPGGGHVQLPAGRPGGPEHRRGTPEPPSPSAGHGKAVHVETMKFMLNAPGTKLLKLNYDEPLSMFAFNVNLRRYTPVPAPAPAVCRPCRWAPPLGGTFY